MAGRCQLRFEAHGKLSAVEMLDEETLSHFSNVPGLSGCQAFLGMKTFLFVPSVPGVLRA